MHMRLGHKSNRDTRISCVHERECIVTHDVVRNSFASTVRILDFMFCVSKHMFS